MTPLSSKGWGGKTEFRKLSSELAALDGLHFQRALLPLLAALYGDAIETAAMRKLDRAGIDLMVWADEGPHPVVVQAKGFQVTTREVGKRQADQCIDSIRSFVDSGIRAHTYLLIHNRDSRNAEFRTPLLEAVDALRDSEQVEEAFAWDRAELLRHVFDAVYRRALEELTRSQDRHFGPSGLEPLENVPLRISAVAISQFAFAEVGEASTSVADPVPGLLHRGEGVVSVLLGEFGLGKTTVARRAADGPGNNVLLVDAGRITRDIVATKDVLALAERAEDVLSHFSVEHRPVIQPILRPAFEKILLDSESTAILLIDGLDESAFLAKPRGLGQLFEMLADVRVPVVLTARTEFWRLLEADFVAFLDKHPPSGPTSSKPPIRCLISELLPWNDEQILTLIDRTLELTIDVSATERLGELVSVIESGRFVDYYGDIPRRPLFLALLVDDVVDGGLRVKGRARLVDEWIRRKIARDTSAPTGVGKIGRTQISAEVEGVAATLDLAYRLMTAAATRMVQLDDETVTLLPSLAIDQLTHKQISELGLVLNTLLIPVGPKTPGKPLEVRFAHRAFQEFFLAWAICEGSAPIDRSKLPEPVTDWVTALEAEFQF